jgi:hypothetical protein
MQVEKVRGITTDIDAPSSLEGPGPKAAQSSAAYGDSTQKCNTCRHFDGTDGCSKVEGKIDPDGHSKFYERSVTANPEPDTEDEYER